MTDRGIPDGQPPAPEERIPLRPTVVIVDDHDLFRGGLRQLLSEEGFEVLAEAANGEAAVEAVRRSAPAVVVMDLHMPTMDGIEATRRLRDVAPATRILILTVSSDDRDVGEAVMAGASGYVLKDAAAKEIVGAIEAVHAGESLLSPRVAAKILERIRDGRRISASRDADLLSDREREILRLIANGKGNAEIAAELFISVPTVKNHVSNVLAKLDVQNRVQAAVQAVRDGLL